MKNIFEFKDYKRYLVYIEDSRKSFQKGFRSKLALHLGCRSAYISHVFNDDAHLSLEQAVRVANFLDLKQKEERYFLLLVEYARAGSLELKNIFEKEIQTRIEENLHLKELAGDSKKLSEQDQSIYYGSWHYLAVHVLSSLPDYNDALSIANALKIPEETVNQALLFLINAQILVDEKGVLKAGVTQVHLERNSHLIRQHHTNWRIAAIHSLINYDKSDLHYSNVSTLSLKDAEKLRVEMVKTIENFIETIKPSKDEVMYGFNLDFYNLTKR